MSRLAALSPPVSEHEVPTLWFSAGVILLGFSHIERKTSVFWN